MRLEPCEFCALYLPHSQLVAHQNMCGAKTQRCYLGCSASSFARSTSSSALFVPLRDRASHYAQVHGCAYDEVQYAAAEAAGFPVVLSNPGGIGSHQLGGANPPQHSSSSSKYAAGYGRGDYADSDVGNEYDDDESSYGSMAGRASEQSSGASFRAEPSAPLRAAMERARLQKESLLQQQQQQQQQHDSAQSVDAAAAASSASSHHTIPSPHSSAAGIITGAAVASVDPVCCVSSVSTSTTATLAAEVDRIEIPIVRGVACSADNIIAARQAAVDADMARSRERLKAQQEAAVVRAAQLKAAQLAAAEAQALKEKSKLAAPPPPPARALLRVKLPATAGKSEAAQLQGEFASSATLAEVARWVHRQRTGSSDSCDAI